MVIRTLNLQILLISCCVFLPAIYQACTENEFTCNNWVCVGRASVCDGVNDCPDGSDESKDLCVLNGTCINGLFQCSQNPDTSSPPYCIRNTSVCNDLPDCAQGEDENVTMCNVRRMCGPNTLRCSSTHCIPAMHVCDGVTDCASGLDERNCTTTACPQPSFICSYGLCIAAELACNGIWNCRDGSDEDPAYCEPSVTCSDDELYCSFNKPGQQCIKISNFCSGLIDCPSTQYTRYDCGTDMCSGSPCGANSYCHTFQLGYECRCNAGYRLTADRKSCQDIDECNETPAVCSQYCYNTEGSYSCGCESGYTSTEQPGACRALDTSITPIILFGQKYFISQIYLNGSGYQPFATNRTFAHVLDFDWQAQKIYHFDVTLAQLHVIDAKGGDDVVLDRMYSTSVEGIALDWIHRKIFWTSTQLMGIYTTELNGSYITPVISGISPNCRGIAVHPAKRIILWTDWGISPFIASIGVDGSAMTKLITTDIYWPNGLTLDYLLNRFWWVDALLDEISYANIDGTGRHLLISKSLSHTYGITQFESALFWTDWNYKSVNTTNDRYTGAYQPGFLNDLPIQPYDIKVFHPSRQPDLTVSADPCRTNNGGCAQICLPSPTLPEGYRCACGQGRPVLDDGKSCPQGCSVSQFSCNDGTCVPWYYECNGRADCLNGEDEPATCGNRTCSPNLFECPLDGGVILCIPQTDVCDGSAQCSDGSDEDSVRCTSRTCQVWEFLCPSTGKCISSSWVCDKTVDCAQGEDEANSNCTATKCTKDQFRCNNSLCIPKSYYCDVDDDCNDRSDEPDSCWLYRNNTPCPAGFRRCPKNYRCIPKSSFCDGLNDCRDGSDELVENCLPCGSGEYTCDNRRCIPLRWRCDFNDDCGDNSDENITMCSHLYRNCTSAEFTCNDHRCIHIHLKCDGNNDCIDGSDELGCDACPGGYFACASRDCIDINKACDGHKDCGDGSDELACPTRYPGGKYCTDDKFTCNNTICLTMQSVCNTIDDCGDGSDETVVACDKVKCPAGTFQCSKVRSCLPTTQVCDGTEQCAFGDDEKFCQNCDGANLFQCQSTSKCIDKTLVCDFKYDCEDGSDERGCMQSDCSVCEQNCTVISSSSSQGICSCWKGYIVDPKNTRTCLERDDCASLAYNWCPQKCIPEKKSAANMTYRCTCVDGFLDLNGDGRTCFPKDGLKGLLLYGLENRVIGQNFTSNEVIEVNELSLHTNAGSEILSVDSDANRRIAYWFDREALFRAALPKSRLDMAYEQKVMSATHTTGLAVDWITGNIYWTDADGVYVTSKSVFWLPTTLLRNTSDTFQPSRIVVNPSIGTLYFINDYQLKPEIWAMDMDGNNPRLLVSRNLMKPSDLALDLSLGNRVFWTDAGQDLIESCLPDGSDRTIHVRDDKHPMRLDVFAGRLYWTTTDRDQMRMADGLGQGLKTVFLSQQINIGPVRYVHPLKYNTYTTNSCDGFGCTFCLLGRWAPRCVCPDRYFFKSGDVKLCDVSAPAGYVPLEDPKLCTCQNQGSCDVLNGAPMCVCQKGFTGEHCDLQVSSGTPPHSTSSSASMRTTPLVSTPLTIKTSLKSTPPVQPDSSTQSTTTTIISPSVTSLVSQSYPSPSTGLSFSPSQHSAQLSSSGFESSVVTVSSTSSSPVVGKADKGKRDLSIALPVVLLSVLLIILIIAVVCAYRRRKLKRGAGGYGRHLDDSSSVSSYPSSPTSPREPVAFQGGSVQFGNENLAYSNPMYKDMAMVLDPPPYSPPYADKLDKKNPDVSEGYDQSSKDNAANEGYDQLKPLEFATFPVTHDSNA